MLQGTSDDIKFFFRCIVDIGGEVWKGVKIFDCWAVKYTSERIRSWTSNPTKEEM